MGSIEVYGDLRQSWGLYGGPLCMETPDYFSKLAALRVIDGVPCLIGFSVSWTPSQNSCQSCVIVEHAL